MAQIITEEQLSQIATTDYDQIRSELRSGDLLFASGNYLISKAIRKVTDSCWSHVGIVFQLDNINRVLLLESVESSGVRFAPLSKYIVDYRNGKPYDGPIVIARHQQVNFEVMSRLAKFGIDELTQPYDKDEVGKILARVILGQGKWQQDREYICSELVYQCFVEAGVELHRDERGFVSPANIWQDDNVKFLARLQ